MGAYLDSLEHVAAGWLAWMFPMTWQVALLAAAVLLVALVARKASPRFRYLLWGLVFIKLCLPPTFAFVTGVGRWLPAAELHEMTERIEASSSAPTRPMSSAPAMRSEELPPLAGGATAEELPFGDRPDSGGMTSFAMRDAMMRHESGRPFRRGGADAAMRPPVMTAPDAGTASEGTDAPETATAAGDATSVAAGQAVRTAFPLSWRVALLSVWALGVMTFAGILLWQYRTIVQRLRGAQAVEDPRILEALERARAAVGLRRSPRLLAASDIESPLVFGLLRPCLVLPAGILGSLPAGELRAILLHELTHLRRGDLLVNWLQVIHQTLYWFHPMVWLASMRFRRERELIVDDAVLDRMSDEPEAYGNSLLSIIRQATRRRMLAPGFVGIIENKRSLARRLRRILDTKRRVSVRLGWFSATLLVALALVLIPQARSQDAAAEKAGEEEAAHAAADGPADALERAPAVAEEPPDADRAQAPAPLPDEAWEPITVGDQDAYVIPEQVLEEIGIPRKEVPPEENAARIYIQAMRTMHEENKTLPADLNDEYREVLDAAPPYEFSEAFLDWFGTTELERNLVHEGAAMEQCQFPVMTGRPGGKMLYSLMLPHLAAMRNFARLLLIEAKVHQSQGRPEDAADSLTTAMRLGCHAGSEPLLISGLVGIACNRIASKGMENLLASEVLEAEALAELQQTLAEIAPRLPGRSTWVPMERAASLQVVDILMKKPGEALGMFGTDPGRLSRLQGGLLGTRAWRILLPDRTMKRDFNSFYDMMEGMAEAPPWVALRAWHERPMEERLAEQVADWNIMAGMLLPGLSRADMEFIRMNAHHAALQLNVALRRFKVANETYPETLDALMPAFMESLPPDPFSGEPFHYELKDGEWKLWSVGANLEDDGGLAVDHVQPDTPGDMVWTSEIEEGKE